MDTHPKTILQAPRYTLGIINKKATAILIKAFHINPNQLSNKTGLVKPRTTQHQMVKLAVKLDHFDIFHKL